MSGGERTRTWLMWGMRYGLPSVFFIVGCIALILINDNMRWDVWAMCWGAAAAVLLLNVLFRFGAKGDLERKDEEDARAFLTKHGHWPDEEPPQRRPQARPPGS